VNEETRVPIISDPSLSPSEKKKLIDVDGPADGKKVKLIEEIGGISTI
jgi:hypothetical protein